VAGPARSGRSTTLLTVAAAARAADPAVAVLGIALRRSALRGHPLVDKLATSVDDVAGIAAAALMTAGPTLLLVDDAETVDDGDGRLAQLLSAGRPHVHVAMAGRPDLLRGMYGHWTQTVRRSKAGVLLQPNLDYDGELLGVALPTRLHVALPLGRGFLVSDGTAGLAQIAVGDRA
jgi:S-DNA-T family DNA segregation ATPase FtsK/SpoIIIE